MQDIKSEIITADQLDELAKKSGSFESLFSRKALKYKSMSLKEKVLNEKDYRKLILEEYTFLKRPVIVFNEEIFVGNSKVVVEAAKSKMNR